MPNLLAAVSGIVLLSVTGMATHFSPANPSPALTGGGYSVEVSGRFGFSPTNLSSLGVTSNGKNGAASKPSTIALLGAGMLFLGWLGRRRAARDRSGAAAAFTVQSPGIRRERLGTREKTALVTENGDSSPANVAS